MSHFSRIVETVANESNSDARTPAIICDLKSYGDFREFMISQPRTSKGAPAKPMSPEDLAHLVGLHNAQGHSKFLCMALAQAMTGVRYDNTQQLFDDKCYSLIEKNCDCDKTSLCNPIKNACISKIRFSKSKTGAFETFAIPQSLACINYLANLGPKEVVSNQAYNKFLSNNTSSSCTSHSIRKFTCNVSFDVRNTGWKSSYNFDKFY